MKATGFSFKVTALATAFALASVAVAQERPLRGPENAAAQGNNEALHSEAARSWDSFLVQAMGDSISDPYWIYPALTMTVIPTIAIYRVRAAWNRRAIQRYVLQTITSSQEYVEAMARVNAQAQTANDALRRALVRARRSDFQQILGRLPAELQREIRNDIRLWNIRLTETGAVTMEELLERLNALHEANRAHYNVARELAPRLERAMSLEAGTITRQLRDPEALMASAYRGGTKVANPAAFARELATFEAEIVRQAARASMTADLPVRGVPWWRVGRNVSARIWRRTWPVAVVGTVIAGGVLWYRGIANRERAAQQAINTEEVRRQTEEQAILRGVLYNEDALTFMVELAWQRLRDRHGAHFRFECPVSFDNANDVLIVAKSFEAANTEYATARRNPFVNREYSVEFFRTFWMNFFEFAAEERNVALRNIRREWLLGPGGDGRGGAIAELALFSGDLFRHASQMVREYRIVLLALVNQSRDERQRILETITDEPARAILARRLAERDRLRGTDGDENGEPRE